MTSDGNCDLVNELTRLRAENARLAGLLEAHGIPWRAPAPGDARAASPSPVSTDEKVALFGCLFRGRTDVYPVRWESKAGKSGYSPAFFLAMGAGGRGGARADGRGGGRRACW